MVQKPLLSKFEGIVRQIIKRLPANYGTVVKGLISYLPGVYTFVDNTRSISARYCYSVWLRHLVIASENGLPVDPQTVVEIGPGSTLGVGLAAMLCGADRHYAVDAIPFAMVEKNLTILDELVEMFTRRADIPHGDDFSTEVRPPLSSYKFPAHILTEERLDRAMMRDRINAIREALLSGLSQQDFSPEKPIRIVYKAPWSEPTVLPMNSADVVLSNTVLQCVENLPFAYSACHYWLRCGGFVSHNIDFSSYGATKEWNGHWACSSLEWRLMRGKRLYLLNRVPYSVHLHLLRENGFRIVSAMTWKTETGIGRNQLSKEFQWLSEEDLHTQGALIQAVK